MLYIQALKNLENVSHLVLNISQYALSVTCLSSLKYEDALGENCPILENTIRRLQTIHFTGKNMLAALQNLKELLEIKQIENIHVFSFICKEKLTDYLGENWKFSELGKGETAFNVLGCDFLLKNIRDEAYSLKNTNSNEVSFINTLSNLYPHILVHISEDVTFTKVTTVNSYETLGSLHFNIKTLLNLFNTDKNTCDLIHTIRLAKLYSSLNNPGRNNSPQLESKDDDASKAHGLIKMFYTNIGQMSAFYAMMNTIKRVIFRDDITSEMMMKEILSESVKESSKGSVDSVFLRHETFMAGIGSILTLPSLELEKSWYENYCESTGQSYQFCFFDGIETKQLTMDSLDNQQLASPLLLNADTYCPDKQNLNNDANAREYWVKCIKHGIQHGVQRQISETSDLKTKEALKTYMNQVSERMDYLGSNPQSYGELCMRILQDTLEHIKRETGLITLYEKRKQMENEVALKELERRLKYIDSLEHNEKQEELIISMLAGNMFDWGAREVAQLMQDGKFGFMQAMEKLPVRPWLIDDLDKWVQRTRGPSHQMAMIFCDNSGYDLILGIIPFTRDLLQRGTKVLICVNKFPVLNDVTYYDLKEVIEKIKTICPIIKNAYDSNNLSFMEINKSTCCLDLRCIDADIAEKMTEIDLLVLEGMGRAIHTNLDAEFNCEALRVGVVKDRWFSQQLGGDSFACVCKYTL